MLAKGSARPVVGPGPAASPGQHRMPSHGGLVTPRHRRSQRDDGLICGRYFLGLVFSEAETEAVFFGQPSKRPARTLGPGKKETEAPYGQNKSSHRGLCLSHMYSYSMLLRAMKS